MQREIRVLAQALAGEFGSPVRAADELRFFIRRTRLNPGDWCVFMPPTERAPRPALLLAPPVLGWQRERLFSLALGHHVLRHRSLASYAYGPDGALFDSPQEAREADYFAECFTLALQGRPQPAAQRFGVASTRGGR